jgi:hypothetical protein
LVEVFSFLQLDEAVQTERISKKMVLPANLVPQLPVVAISTAELDRWFGGGQDTEPIQTAMTYWSQSTRVLKIDAGRPGLDEMLHLVAFPKVHTLRIAGNMTLNVNRWSLILRTMPALTTLKLYDVSKDLTAEQWNQPEMKRPWKSVTLRSVYEGFKSWTLFANPSLTELEISGDEERTLDVKTVETLVSKAPALQRLLIYRSHLDDADQIYLLLARGLPKLKELIMGGTPKPVIRQGSTLIALYKAWPWLNRFPPFESPPLPGVPVETLSQLPTNQLTEASTLDWVDGKLVRIEQWLAVLATSNRWRRIYIQGNEMWEAKTIAGLLRDLPDLIDLRVAPFQFSTDILRAIVERKKPCPWVHLGGIWPSRSPRQFDATTTGQDLVTLISSGNVSQMSMENVVLQRITTADLKELDKILHNTNHAFYADFDVHVDQVDLGYFQEHRLDYVEMPVAPDQWNRFAYATIRLRSKTGRALF